MTCTYCGNPLTGRQKLFCSINCKTYTHLKAWRRRTKIRAVEFKGGKCEECGYSKNVAALIFHHPEDNKSFGIGGACSWTKIQAELEKCQLLCLNCHAEEHHEDLQVCSSTA